MREIVIGGAQMGPIQKAEPRALQADSTQPTLIHRHRLRANRLPKIHR